MIKLPEWKKNLAVMWFAQLAGMGAITGVMSFLPLYVPQLGITKLEEVEFWSGILMGVSSLFAALAGPHWGALADRKGRKPMVERVMLAFAIVMGLMALVTNVYQLLVLRIIQGIFGGFTAAALALVTSITPEEELGFTMGVFQTAMIAGSAFGPMFGGFVADHFGYRSAFVAFSLLCLASLTTIHFFVSERFVPVRQEAKPSVRGQVLQVLAIPGLKGMLFVQFLVQFAVQVIAPVLPLYVKTLAPNITYVASVCGAIISAAGLTSALASAVVGTLSKRIAHHTILFVGASLAALSFAGQALAPSVLTLGVLRGVSGLFIGSMLPSVNALISLLIPPAKRGVAFGVTTAASQMGNVLGPVTGGAIALSLTIPAVFWLTAGLFAVVAVWVALRVRDPRRAPLGH